MSNGFLTDAHGLGDAQLLRGVFETTGAQKAFYVDENEVTWVINFVGAKEVGASPWWAHIDATETRPAEGVAWDPGDVYGLTTNGTDDEPLVKGASAEDAAGKIDGWILAKGKTNPNWQTIRDTVTKRATGKGPINMGMRTVDVNLGLWGWLAAVVGLYLISDYNDKSRRKRK